MFSWETLKILQIITFQRTNPLGHSPQMERIRSINALRSKGWPPIPLETVHKWNVHKTLRRFWTFF